MINRIINKIDCIRYLAAFSRFIMGGKYPAYVERINSLANAEYYGIIFDTPSPLAQWRAQTHLSKEPGTIQWINEFSSDDVFFDIGANIGVYSLYAALKKSVKVYAFEPSPNNFSTLSRNISLNKMSDKISAFCVAINDKTVLDRLYLSSEQAGAAHTGFSKAQNEFGVSFTPVHTQHTLGFSLDELITIFKFPVPNHIKIDVDGAEHSVISGAQKTFENPSLRSVLVELPARSGGDSPVVLKTICSYGFKLVSEDHPDGDLRLSNYILKRF